MESRSVTRVRGMDEKHRPQLSCWWDRKVSFKERQGQPSLNFGPMGLLYACPNNRDEPGAES